MTRKIVDCKVEKKGAVLVRTLIYSDGSRETRPVSEAQIDKLLKAVEATPQLKVVKGSRGFVAEKLLMWLAVAGFVAAACTGCHDVNPECTGRNWHRSTDCNDYYDM